MSSGELIEAIEETDEGFSKTLKEEQKLIQKINSDAEQNSENIETEKRLEELNNQTAETIQDAIQTNSNVQLALQKYVDEKIKNYGSIETVFEKIKNPDLKKTPRFFQKMMLKHLPNVIDYLKKNSEKNPEKKELADMLEILLEKIKDNLVKTKRNNLFTNFKTNFKTNYLSKGGRSKRQRPNKTKKHIKGGNDEGTLQFIALVSFLIACCCTGIGCFICGPLLVATICVGMAVNGANICGSLVVVPSNKDPRKENPDNKKGGKKKNTKTKRMKKTKRNNK